MKKFLKATSLLMLSAMISYSYSAFADAEENRVTLEPEVIALIAGQSQLEFQLYDTETHKVLSDKDLKVAHEKKLHLLIYDAALREFQHVHPEFDGKLWSVEVNFKVNGSYWVWAQGELLDGEEFSASNRLNISGGDQAWPSITEMPDERVGIDENSQVDIGNTEVVAGEMVMLDLKFTRTDGSQPSIEPYLGAMAHVVAVPEAGDSLIHVHPMEGASPNEGMLHATFPVAGSYRLWIQFLDGGKLRTVALAVKVVKK